MAIFILAYPSLIRNVSQNRVWPKSQPARLSALPVESSSWVGTKAEKELDNG